MNELIIELQRRIELLETRQRVESDPHLAWNLKDGAALLGLSYRSVNREIKRRKIIPTEAFDLLTKTELLRYLDEEVQIRRKKVFGNTRRKSV